MWKAAASRIQAIVAANLTSLFAIARNTIPILKIGKIALVTRRADVLEVLADDNTFMVTYEPKMRVVAGGSNFFLGMGDAPQYHRDATNWNRVFPAGDASSTIGPMVSSQAQLLVETSDGSIDAVEDLASIVACHTVEKYMGVTGPTQPEMVDWTTALFGYLFYPSGPDDDAKAARIAATARDHIDAVIAERKRSGEQIDDGLGRALSFQAAGEDGFSDLEIRNNLIGIIIGAVPTTSKCAALVLDYLLDHPKLLAQARQASLDGDWALVNGFVEESLRFNPFGPVLLRECMADYKVAKGKLRGRKIKKGNTVAVATLSAMFDGRMVDKPKDFIPTRTPDTYMTYGTGMHTCFGYAINGVQIARIVGSVLVRDNLQRAPGDAGKIQSDGQFPTHLRLTFTQ